MNQLITLSFIVLLALATATTKYGQDSHTLKGQVLDENSEMPLIGANVIIMGTDPMLGTSTDIDGYFTINEVPLGRYTIEVSYLGYEPMTIPNVELFAGKQSVLNIKMQEQYNQLDEVVITAENRKDETQNEMAAISARQFSVEEVNRYAGGRTDVSRLVSNFAGVSAPDDSRNDIVVRGNSPTGVLWQLEGIPIPLHGVYISPFISIADIYTKAIPVRCIKTQAVYIYKQKALHLCKAFCFFITECLLAPIK